MSSFDGDGLVIDRLADIKEQMITDLQSVFGTGLNTAETSPWGVIIGIMSERYSLLYELLEAVYLASFPSGAYGIYLDQIAAYNAVVRESATYSTVVLEFTRSNPTGTTVAIPAGTQVAAAAGSEIIWSTDIEVTIASGDTTVDAAATASETGVVGALADTLDTMISPPPNVASVNNDLDAVTGEAEETDAELKVRRQTQLGRTGTSTEAGIIAALQLLDPIRRSTVIINDTDSTVGSLPPHSIEAYVSMETGEAIADNYDLLAQTVWDSKAAGIQTYGSLSGTAEDDAGTEHTVYFSEMVEVRLYVRFTFTTDGDYDSTTAEAAIKQAIVDYGTTNLLPGVDVLTYKLLSAASDVGSAGILGIVCEISTDGAAYAATNLTVDPDDFASIASGDITFV